MSLPKILRAIYLGGEKFDTHEVFVLMLINMLDLIKKLTDLTLSELVGQCMISCHSFIIHMLYIAIFFDCDTSLVA